MNKQQQTKAYIAQYGYSKFVAVITDAYLLAYSDEQLANLWAMLCAAIALHESQYNGTGAQGVMSAMLSLHSDIGSDLDIGALK
jgi:hypothetical protein